MINGVMINSNWLFVFSNIFLNRRNAEPSVAQVFYLSEAAPPRDDRPVKNHRGGALFTLTENTSPISDNAQSKYHQDHQ